MEIAWESVGGGCDPWTVTVTGTGKGKGKVGLTVVYGSTDFIGVEVKTRCRLIQEGGIDAREGRGGTTEGQQAVKKAV